MISETCLLDSPPVGAPLPERKKTGRVKAVGLLSGGLDSSLAALIMRDLNVEIYGLCFALPWGCCSKDKAREVAQTLGIKFMVLQLDEAYLEVIKNPRYGRGRALNPCVDCRIHMFSRARKYMEQMSADFVFTGEVLGQRPMSQLRHSLGTIEEDSGLKGRLLRPLSAKLLEPTIAEEKGWVDREKLLAISGRSRKDQMALAGENGIVDYPNPAGGCLLTDENFSRKMWDLLQHGYRNFREAVTLKWGRHFRLSRNFKVIVGRDEEENSLLKRFAHERDIIIELEDGRGPTAILKGDEPDEEALSQAAGLVQHFSRHRGEPSVEVTYHAVNQPHEAKKILSVHLDQSAVAQLQI